MIVLLIVVLWWRHLVSGFVAAVVGVGTGGLGLF